MTTIILTLLALLGGLRSALQLEPGAEPWRILTCHFTHWTYEHLAWDALAFLALGIACERGHRAAFHGGDPPSPRASASFVRAGSRRSGIP